jgi:hypothetical protein
MSHVVEEGVRWMTIQLAASCAPAHMIFKAR